MVQDPVIPRMTALVELTNLASSHCLPMGVVNNLYNTLGIGYFRIITFCVEKKVKDVIIYIGRLQASIPLFV
jgi:hypothetical protein